MVYNPADDLRILVRMASQVEVYLRENELLWPLGGRNMPRLTLGGYLLRQHRLTTLRGLLDDAQQQELDAALATYAEATAQWGLHFDQKAAREWDMRVNLLQNFLQDCDDSGGRKRDCGDYWPGQAEHRTMLQHLYDALLARDALVDDQRDMLAAIDRGLRRFLMFDADKAFIWADGLQEAYPPDVYWWLWVIPRSDLNDSAAA